MASAFALSGSGIVSGATITWSLDGLSTRPFLLGLDLALKEKDIHISIAHKYKASKRESLRHLPRDGLEGWKLCGS